MPVPGGTPKGGDPQPAPPSPYEPQTATIIHNSDPEDSEEETHQVGQKQQVSPRGVAVAKPADDVARRVREMEAERAEATNKMKERQLEE